MKDMDSKKTFNFYCDESCHLENDGRKYMIISYISCAYNQLRMHNEYIRSLKLKHHMKGEVKWNALSKSRYHFYADLVEYFFSNDMQFRAIVIDKSEIENANYNQTHDDFYNKMYYQLLYHKLNTSYTYNIYIDIKDTHSYKKAHKLKEYLNNTKNINCIRNLHIIRSYESELMQLTDVLMGAISYRRNQDKMNVIAKKKIVEKIEKHHGNSILSGTSVMEDKFNLFYIDLK